MRYKLPKTKGIAVIRERNNFVTERANDLYVFKEIKRRHKHASLMTVIKGMIDDKKTWGVRMGGKSAASWKRKYLQYRRKIKGFRR